MSIVLCGEDAEASQKGTRRTGKHTNGISEANFADVRLL
jgi:hypothetical protein